MSPRGRRGLAQAVAAKMQACYVWTTASVREERHVTITSSQDHLTTRIMYCMIQLMVAN